MSHVSLFTYGAITPIFAYLVSFLGCLLGLLCVSRGRVAERSSRVQWLLGASVAIGGIGVWTAHFIAMSGFGASDMAVRYDVMLTVLSVCVVLPAVGGGVFLAYRRGTRPGMPLAAGTLAGLGITGMHYLSVAAIEVPAQVAHNTLSILVTTFFAISASVIALWCVARVRGRLAGNGAALLMAAGFWIVPHLLMVGMSVAPDGSPVPPGATRVELLIPALGVAGLVTVGLLLSILLTPSEAEIEADAALLAQVQARATRRDDPIGDPFRPSSPDFTSPMPAIRADAPAGGPLPDNGSQANGGVFADSGPADGIAALAARWHAAAAGGRANGKRAAGPRANGGPGDGFPAGPVQWNGGPADGVPVTGVPAPRTEAEDAAAAPDPAERYGGGPLFQPRR